MNISFNDFLHEREALAYGGDMYKKAVTRYYRTQDYFLKTSSSQEGHFPDIILTKKDQPEFWVEAKSGKVSIFEKRFKKELLQYFIEWLKLSDNKRFSFGIFVSDLVKKEETKIRISKNAKIKPTVTWVRDIEGIDLKPDDRDLLENANEKEIENFFHSIEVNICPGFELDQITKERMKELKKYPNTQERILLRETISRRKPSSTKSELISNFMKLSYPTIFWEVLSKYKRISFIYKHSKEGERLPAFVIPRYEDGDPVIRSFESNLSLLQQFMLNQQIQRSISALTENRRLQLINEHLRRWLWCKGLRRSGNDYFFPYENFDVEKNEEEFPPLTIEGTRGPKVITRPMYKDGLLNFVQHHAVNIWLSKLGKDYGIFIWPKFIFTTDGITRIEGDWASKIYRKYLRAEFNYNPNKRSQLNFWQYFLLNGPFVREPDSWFDTFQLHPLLKKTVSWSSNTIEKGKLGLAVFWEDEE